MIRLEHANISATDVEAMTAFITTAFPEFHVRHQGTDMTGKPWRHIGNDDFYIAVSTVREHSGRKPYSDVTGLNHLGWEVDNLAELEARMKAAGYQPNLKAHAHPARNRTYFYDPDGNDWEFVEYASDDPAERNDYSDAS